MSVSHDFAVVLLVSWGHSIAESQKKSGPPSPSLQILFQLDTQKEQMDEVAIGRTLSVITTIFNQTQRAPSGEQEL